MGDAISPSEEWKAVTLGDLEDRGELGIQNGFPCGNHNSQGNGIPHLRPMNVDEMGNIALGTVKYIETDRDIGRYLIAVEDVIFNNTNSEALVGKTGLWTGYDFEATLSNHMTRIRTAPSSSVCPAYLARALHRMWLTGMFLRMCRRHVNQASVSKERLRRVGLDLPSMPEQRAIAGVLSKIQEAIAAQERIIERTRELKRALMAKLFTEGLRGEPQKMSEVGPMPGSWRQVRCADVCERVSVGIVVRPAQYYVPQGVPCFRSANVRADRLDPTDLVFISEESNTKLAKSKLKAGDVLIVRTGYPGAACVVPKEYEGANCIDLIFARVSSCILSEFLCRFLNSSLGKRQITVGDNSAQQHFNVGQTKLLLIPLPGLDEQREIVGAVGVVEKRALSAEARRGDLAELFKAMLHELMTGRIRTTALMDEGS